MKTHFPTLYFLVLALMGKSFGHTQNLDIFDGNGDIGPVKNPGSAEFDASTETYTVAGSGTNMWGETDEFHFVRKKMYSDVSLAADIEWVGDGTDPHRKACLMIRQSLEPGSAYDDAAVHGDGLTSIQYRDTTGGPSYWHGWSPDSQRVAFVSYRLK
ncbi:WD40-like Beta Propeller Repeat [Pricia antarctica]|uniref:WD40-like Beta Propeller Repeat n=1 Tax=Pricia antarctica TaxID=641691 RepID=A0A1G6YWW3_9FLAO|nr:PD40 domain-containing protein [Pricia antarctica]SDD94994.1 WD40-like Beta Propeller Repeat [Pricia antarctica]